MPAKKKPAPSKAVETLKHDEAKRKNIPSVEQQSFVEKEQQSPKTIRYPRNTDLDPQLVWRGKDEQDWSDLVVHAPSLYIQEKVHLKALIDDLLRQSKETAPEVQFDLFANETSLLRLVTGVLMEISEEWETGKIDLQPETKTPTY
jgi:adenine-specific DNA-methyltransferase